MPRPRLAILNGPPPSADPSTGEVLGEQLAQLRYQNEVAQIDREWEAERERYTFPTRYGTRMVPTPGMGIGTAVGTGFFGVLWTIFAFAITSDAPNFGPFIVAKFLFPLFGIGFTIAGIIYGISIHSRGMKYQQAYDAYLARRASLRPAGSAYSESPPLPKAPASWDKSDDRFHKQE